MPCHWSVKDKAILVAKGRRWTSERHTMGEFIEWAAVNWHRACALGWPHSLKKGAKFVTPKFPSLHFLLWGWDTFVVVFERGLSVEHAKLSGRETRFYQEARERGLTEDAARREAFRKVAQAEVEGRLEEKAREIEDRARHAERMLGAAEQARLEAQRAAVVAARPDDRPRPTLNERRDRLARRMSGANLPTTPEDGEWATS